MRLTLRQLSVYIGHIPTIMAKEAMTSSVIASMPYMDDETRNEVLRDWQIVSGGEASVGVPDKIEFKDFAQEIKQRIV